MNKNDLLAGGMLLTMISAVVFVVYIFFFAPIYSCPDADNNDAYNYVMNKYPSAEIVQFKEEGQSVGVKFRVNGTTKYNFLRDCGDVYEYKNFWFVDEWESVVVDNWHMVNYGKSQRFADREW